MTTCISRVFRFEVKLSGQIEIADDIDDFKAWPEGNRFFLPFDEDINFVLFEPEEQLTHEEHAF